MNIFCKYLRLIKRPSLTLLLVMLTLALIYYDQTFLAAVAAIAAICSSRISAGLSITVAQKLR